MPHPSQIGDSTDPIQDLAADFESCARRAIECMLNQPTLLSKAFNLQTRGPPEPGVRCFIESGNGDQAFRISLALSENDLSGLFPHEEDGDMGRDAMGEILNIIAGTLFKRPGFRSAFGCLRASVPSFAAPRFETGTSRIIRGALIVGSARVILELAVDSRISGGKE